MYGVKNVYIYSMLYIHIYLHTHSRYIHTYRYECINRRMCGVRSPFHVNDYIQAQMTEAGYDYNTSTPKPQMTVRPALSKKVFPVAGWAKKRPVGRWGIFFLKF